MQFNKMIEQCYQERKAIELQRINSYKYNCDYEYALFSIWCRINDIEPTENNFKIYIKENNKNFNFWESKYIYETYFNYEFNYDFNNNKWHCNKK